MNRTARNYALTQDKILSESELKLMLKTIRPSMDQHLVAPVTGAKPSEAITT